MKKNGKMVAMFDLDGTLVNTDNINNAAYRKALARLGIRDITVNHKRITKKLLQAIAPNLSMSDLQAISKAKQEEFIQLLWGSDMGPAAEAFRKVLANRDAYSKIVLLTDAQEQRAIETLRFHGIDSCFDEVVCNEGKGDKYLNYFRCHDANPAFTVIWENDGEAASSAVCAGVNFQNIKKVR